MQYTAKPVTVEAIRYDAPDAESEGNLAELEAMAPDLLQKQDPWNPAAGQSCLLLLFPALPVAHDVDSGEPTAYAEPETRVIKPGDYLVLDDGLLSALDGALFESLYDVPADGDPNAELQAATDNLTAAVGADVPTVDSVTDTPPTK